MHTPNDLTRTIRTKIEISEDNFHDGEPCWLWTGAVDRYGYASAKMKGKVIIVHRYVYDRLIGGLDDELTIDHLCKGHRNCVNPAHFEQVSRTENSIRANQRRWDEGYRRNTPPSSETSAP